MEAGARTAFFRIGAASSLVVTGALLVASLVRNDGHLLYVIDDAGIHLSLARQLATHGTWGPYAGHYASASSSPGWTLLLAALSLGHVGLLHVLPLVLNVAAGLWIIWLFARHQDYLLPGTASGSPTCSSRSCPSCCGSCRGWRWSGWSMRCTRRSCCRRSCCSRACRRAGSPCGGAGRSSPSSRSGRSCATSPRSSQPAARRESCWRPRSRLGTGATRSERPARASLTLAALTAAACALPIVIFGLVNRAFGEGFLPNSVVAKALVGKGTAPLVPSIDGTMRALQQDGMVLVPTLAVAAYLIWAWFGGPRGNVALATVFLVAALLHVAYADFHYFERYQAYLVIAGFFVLLRLCCRGRAPGVSAGCARVRPRRRARGSRPARITTTYDARRSR